MRVLLLDLRLDVSCLWWHLRLQWIDMRLGLNVPNVDLNWIQVDFKHLTHADPLLIVASPGNENTCMRLDVPNSNWPTIVGYACLMISSHDMTKPNWGCIGSKAERTNKQTPSLSATPPLLLILSYLQSHASTNQSEIDNLMQGSASSDLLEMGS
jgi:hypothetical protein